MDARAFDDSTRQVLATLVVMGGESAGWHSAVELSTQLRDTCGINLHWRTIDALLAKDRSLASRRKRLGRWEYKVLEGGRAQVVTDDQAVIFVDPESALQSTLKLHDLLATLSGTVSVCDPYLDQLTIEHLEACGVGKPIRVLSQKVNDTGPLRRIVDAARVAGHLIEVRVVATKVLHDRYVIDDKSLLILGASLNGFGKKQSFVIKLGADIRKTVLVAFNEQWDKASSWP